jgi:hypothetical protein
MAVVQKTTVKALANSTDEAMRAQGQRHQRSATVAFNAGSDRRLQPPRLPAANQRAIHVIAYYLAAQASNPGASEGINLTTYAGDYQTRSYHPLTVDQFWCTSEANPDAVGRKTHRGSGGL